MLEDFKCDLGIFDTTKDRQLQRLLDKAITDVINLTHQSNEYVQNKLREQVIDLAIIRYNRKGAEGLTTQSYSGISESYLEDIPITIKQSLLAHRRPES